MKYQSSSHRLIGVLVSELLQQRKEEVQKTTEEAEVLARLEQEAKAATNPAMETNGAEVTKAKQVLFSIGVAHIIRAQPYWILIFYTIPLRLIYF